MKISFSVPTILGAIVLVFFVLGLVSILRPIKIIEVENNGSQSPEEFQTSIPTPIPANTSVKTPLKPVFLSDVELQKQLADPPKIVKAVYLTGWSAGQEEKIKELIDLARTGKINAVVIDVKDFSGKVSYDTDVKEAENYFAEEARIPKINSLVKRLHDEGIYVIARQAVFQDQILAAARPEFAVKSIKSLTSYGAGIWRDYKGLAWIDPAATASWDYNVKIASDAWNRGFDEINFDYIRFPTDGDLDDRKFPVWDGKRLMSYVMKDFYKEIRRQMPEARLSIDLFGLAATTYYDFGVGQTIEDAYDYFDFVSPMLYPSHFPLTFLDLKGEKKPADYPYEVVRQSMDTAILRLKNRPGSRAQLRPWLQDFDLGADYDAVKVKAQIQAAVDSFGGEESEDYRGFMLWSPTNIYTKEAL